MKQRFYNSSKLIRFILRKERISSSLWIIGLVLFSAILASSMANMFDEASRMALVETLKNPAMIAMMGPIYGIDNYTFGAMYSHTMLLWVVIAVAVMNIFFVVRHTRADEDHGRIEVVRSLPSGRIANLHATMVSAVMINSVLAVLTAIGLAITGDDSMSFVSCILYGLILGSSGLLFAAIAALFAQVSNNAGGAIGYSLLSLGVFYIMRAAGDLKSEALSVISPLGLIQRTQIFVENNWWVLPILLLEFLAIATLAYWVNSKLDMNQGIIPVKQGKKRASAWLRSSFGLSYRLLRATIIIWFIVLFLLGASYGSIFGDIDTFIGENELYQNLVGVNDDYSITVMYAVFVNKLMSLVCLIPLLMIALKARREESDGRAENVLTRAVSRQKYLLGYLSLAFVSSVLFQIATAVGMYIAASSALPNPDELGIGLGLLLRSNLIYLPALWVSIALAVFLTGILPKAANAIWLFFGFSFIVVFFGLILNLPTWIEKLCPFSYIPLVPIDDVNYLTLGMLTFIAIVLSGIGFFGYRRRDLTS